jgi:hypothetical protein
MIPKNFWRLIAVGLAAFVACCLISVPLAPELAILVLLAYVGGQLTDRLDRISEFTSAVSDERPLAQVREAAVDLFRP